MFHFILFKKTLYPLLQPDMADCGQLKPTIGPSSDIAGAKLHSRAFHSLISLTDIAKFIRYLPPQTFFLCPFVCVA
jgi:hypothetical protein